MNSRRKVAAGTVVVLIIGAALGPVPRTGRVDAAAIAARVPSAATDIAGWLALAEAREHDVTPGAEKSIVWAGAPGVRTPLAIVYLHGFSATRQEVSPVVENAARDVGANAFFTRFTGHGQPGARLAEATATDWIADTVEAIEIGKRLGDRVLLIGTSTGATLALDREARAHDPAVMGVVAISPNFGPHSKAAELVLWPWLSWVLPPVLGDREWTPRNELQGRYWTTKYPTGAIVPMMTAVEHAREAPLEGFSVPVLLIWSPQDDVVDPALTEAAFARLPEGLRERESVTCPIGGECHVLAGDILAPEGNAMVEAWIGERVRRWPR